MEAEKATLEKECKELEVQLQYRSEANLFQMDGDFAAEDILHLIKAARDSAHANDLHAARFNLLRAACLLDRAVAKRGRLWSLLHIHAVPIWAYHVTVVSVVIAATVYCDALNAPVTSGPSSRILVAMGLYGVLGGAVRGLYWLYRKVQTKSFRTQFFLPHLCAPWLSFVLGILSFILLNAGVGIFSKPSGLHGVYPYATAAALAGFSWEWFVEQLAKARRAA